MLAGRGTEKERSFTWAKFFKVAIRNVIKSPTNFLRSFCVDVAFARVDIEWVDVWISAFNSEMFIGLLTELFAWLVYIYIYTKNYI